MYRYIKYSKLPNKRSSIDPTEETITRAEPETRQEWRMPLKTNKKKQQPIVWHQFFSISQKKFAWICSENIYVKCALRNCLITRGFKWNSSKKDNLRQESSVSREILQWIAQILLYVYHLINAFFLHLCKSALSFFSISVGESGEREDERIGGWAT